MGDKSIEVYIEDKLTDSIIQAIIAVHKTLGPGFLENIYRKSLVIELQSLDLCVETEKEINIHYKGQIVGVHRLDILVEKQIVMELKTVEALSKAHYAQIRSYLQATGLKTGLLVNFATAKADFRRIDT